MELTHFSLFTGIGGLDLAAEWAGFKTVGQCEYADYPTKVLEKHWPNVPRWKDVRKLTVESIRERGIGEITVLSGGFPCQPHSLAGKRKASADERDLWPEYRRVIGEFKPRWVVAENVRGLLSSEDGRFFRGILRDLSDLGFNVGWCLYPAAQVRAVHERIRMFTIAHANSRTIQHVGISAYNGVRERQTQKWSEDWYKFELGFGKVAPSEWWDERGIPEPFICREGNGISSWVDRWHCLGNAVVPQQAYPIFKSIADIERGIE